MICSTLSPPQQLSDIIVGKVIQRSGGRRLGEVIAADHVYRKDCDVVSTSSHTFSFQVSSEASPRNHMVSNIGVTNSGLKPILKVAVTSGNHVGTDQGLISTQAETMKERQKFILQTPPDLLNDISQCIIRQREKRRVSQQRYRMKKRHIAMSLQWDVRRLREQIQQHELERRILLSRPPTSLTPWIVVSEYFRLFRNGLKGTRQPNSMFKQATREQGGIQQLSHLMTFLYEVMSPDVSVNSGFGVDAIIQEWSTMPLMHQDITVRLVRLEYDEENVILATTKAYTTITKEMLRCEFPCFFDRNHDHQTPRLVAKLVGQQLVIPTTVRFEWDSQADRVLGMHSSSDLVTPFLKLLGNVQDTARVLNALRKPRRARLPRTRTTKFAPSGSVHKH